MRRDVVMGMMGFACVLAALYAPLGSSRMGAVTGGQTLGALGWMLLACVAAYLTVVATGHFPMAARTIGFFAVLFSLLLLLLLLVAWMDARFEIAEGRIALFVLRDVLDVTAGSYTPAAALMFVGSLLPSFGALLMLLATLLLEASRCAIEG
jgi:hypothetical protein